MSHYTYLFESHDNGYGLHVERTYFTSDKELTQELVTGFIKKHNCAATRMGSSFHDFEEGAKDSGYKIERLKGQHTVINVFQNVTGNY